MNRAKQATEVTDRLAVQGKYPRFEYDKLKPEMDKLEKELPGSSVLERAALAAQRTGNEAQLLPPAPAAPMSQPAVPSMSAASGMTGAPPQQSQQGPSYEQVWTQAAKLGMGRNSVDQGVALDQLLKMKLGMSK